MRFYFERIQKTQLRFLVFIGCAVVSLLLSSCGNDRVTVPQSTTQSERAQPRTNLPLPPNSQPNGADSSGRSSFTLLDSRRMQLSDLTGQVVVLDFWATYCPPCLIEIPHLVELQRQYGPQGLRVIGLNVGGPDDRPKVPAFVEQFRVQYTLGYPDAEMTELYLGSDDRIPQTFVFNREGKMVKHFVGFDGEMSAELERTIQAALSNRSE